MNSKRIKRSLTRLGLAVLVVALLLAGPRPVSGITVPWYEGGVGEATARGIVPLRFVDAGLNRPVTRGEFAEVIVRSLVSAREELPRNTEKDVFTDTQNVFVNMAFALEIVSGYPDGTFRPDGAIRREEMFVMIHKLFLRLGIDDPVTTQDHRGMDSRFSDAPALSPWAREAAAMVTSRGIVAGTPRGTLEPGSNTTRAESLIIVNNALNRTGIPLATLSTVNRLLHDLVLAAAETPSRGAEEDSRTRFPDASPEEREMLLRLGDNPVKHALIFGSPDAPRFASAEEARSHMVSISVDVWQLSSTGNKTTGTRSITVHHAISGTVRQIFREIYEGPERFPIKDVGGFSWRSNPNSEHRWGIAIDINANENYMIRNDGTILAGSFWKPGENPYSILPDGDVVRAFRRHGFTWGGNAWPTSRDYMHFSFQGR